MLGGYPYHMEIPTILGQNIPSVKFTYPRPKRHKWAIVRLNVIENTAYTGSMWEQINMISGRIKGSLFFLDSCFRLLSNLSLFPPLLAFGSYQSFLFLITYCCSLREYFSSSDIEIYLYIFALLKSTLSKSLP